MTRTVNEEQPKQRRKRRTRAEIEAAKAGEQVDAAPQQEDQPAEKSEGLSSDDFAELRFMIPKKMMQEFEAIANYKGSTLREHIGDVLGTHFAAIKEELIGGDAFIQYVQSITKK
jgi:hypothetical protein